MARLLERGLREEGHATDVVGHGEDALWMARAASYDAIVLDVMLPGLDGVAVVGADDVDRLRLLNADLLRVGASLGARAIVALPASACGACETARAARYLAGESAGQCGPCVHGVAAIADVLEQISAGRDDPRRSRLGRWLADVNG